MPQNLNKKNKKIPKEEFRNYCNDDDSRGLYWLTDLGSTWYDDYLNSHLKDIDYILSLIYLTMTANGSFFVDQESDIYCYAQKMVKKGADEGTALFEYIISKSNMLDIWRLTTRAVTYPDSDYIVNGDFGSWRFVGDVVHVMLKITGSDKILDLSVEKQGFTYDVMTILETFYFNCDVGELDSISRTFLDKRQAYLAEMFVAIMSNGAVNTDFTVGDPLTPPSTEYNKAFAYPPVGLHQAIKKKKYSSILYPDIKFTNPFHEQWIYVDRMLSHLEGKDARAVALLYGRSLMQAKDNEFLQRLIDDGWIESIIEMPTPELVKEVGSIPYFVIFSRNNEKASVGCMDYYDTDDYQDIKLFLDGDKTTMKTINGNEINLKKDLYSKNELKNINTLIPSKMPAAQGSKKSSETKVFVKDVAKVFVSTQYTTNDFELSNESTGYKLLTSKDISNSQIQWDELESIVMTKSLYDKYVLEEGDIVITNKTTNVKSAVVDVAPIEKVIPTNSAIVVRPNKELLNPTYFKIFLDSEDTKSLLMASQTGSSSYNFTQSFIENLEIPMVDLEKQKAKAEKYLGMVSSINAYRDCINKLETEMSYLIDDEED